MRALALTAVVLGLALAPGLAQAQVKIVIDAGHGGTDPGGVGTGMQEKNVVLDVSKRFKALLDADTADEAGGGKWTALMTRSTDVFVTLAGRSAYSNNNDADRFMCIHANAFCNPSANAT
jgi:N-acetylmuramoyl-L-alanine amidase